MKMQSDDETMRDDFETGDCCGNSNFEKNCKQIFVKGPALTKEILGKVNAEIVPKQTYIFGYELKTKRVLLTSGLCLLFFLSFLGATIMWCTNTFDNQVLSQLVLENNSATYNVWKKPPVHAIYKVYIFNYTNLDDFKNGYVDKLQVEETGPYAYEETIERVHVTYPTEDTISYQEERNVQFMPELSKGRQNDQLTVPNLAVISGSAATKSKSYFNRLAFSGLLSGMDEEAFSTIAAESFITGYKDRFYSLARSFLPFESPEEMGIMITKKGLSPNRITINTGKNDMNKYATVEKFNDERQFNYFADDFCNSIESTDGSLHPPKRIQEKQPIFILFPEGCRRMPLIFEKESTVLDGKVPAYQYGYPENMFDSADENPENGCYCSLESAECPLKGVFNVTSCNYGSPVFISYPHFHRADPSLVKPFIGLHPERTNYTSYFKYHPTMGFALAAKTYFQLNIQLQKASGVSQVDHFEDGTIFPIAYLEGTKHKWNNSIENKNRFTHLTEPPRRKIKPNTKPTENQWYRHWCRNCKKYFCFCLRSIQIHNIKIPINDIDLYCRESPISLNMFTAEIPNSMKF